MKIVNKTDISYQYLGWIIDKIIEMGKEDTHYYGQVQLTSIVVENNREIKVQIRYLKRYCEFRFEEVKKDETNKK